MQESMNWSRKYYSDAAQAEIESRQREWTPDLQVQAEKDWSSLFADVEAAIANNVDPASKQSQALVERWKKLLAGFTGGNPEIQRGLNKMWADRENWPASMKRQSAPFASKEVWEYMGKAMACSA